MVVWKRKNYKGSKKAKQWLPQVHGDGGKFEQVKHRWFLRWWNYSTWYSSSVYMVLHISQNHRTVQRRVRAKVNYPLQLKIIYQEWFINCNKCAMLIQDINKGKVYMTVGGVWELCTNCLRKVFLKMEKKLKKKTTQNCKCYILAYGNYRKGAPKRKRGLSCPLSSWELLQWALDLSSSWPKASGVLGCAGEGVQRRWCIMILGVKTLASGRAKLQGSSFVKASFMIMFLNQNL